jgi:hypothetical protein
LGSEHHLVVSFFTILIEILELIAPKHFLLIGLKALKGKLKEAIGSE